VRQLSQELLAATPVDDVDRHIRANIYAEGALCAGWVADALLVGVYLYSDLLAPPAAVVLSQEAAEHASEHSVVGSKPQTLLLDFGVLGSNVIRES
jgi:hypothetical protein